jgi:hypothetical protein
MSPELPFLAAGAVSVVGGAIADKKWPSNGMNALIGTAALVVVASATTGSKAAPLVHAVGLLLLVTSVMAAVRQIQKRKK